MRLILGVLVAALVSLAIPAGLAQTDDFASTGDLVVIETQLGTITVELFDLDAPLHTENFRERADSDYYNSTIFHRIIPGFMIQGGDPNTIDGDPLTWGQGGPDETLIAEFNNIRHERGILSMARSADPDSAGSQFFIVHQSSGFLDQNYTAFGRVVTQESFDVLDAIVALETDDADRPVNVESARVSAAYTIPRADVADLLDLEPALRLDAPGSDVEYPDAPVMPDLVDGVYTNTKLNVTFVPPTGWTISEPPKTQPHIPDVVMVAASTAPIPPGMTLFIEYATDRDIEAYADERMALYQPAVEAGVLSIDSRSNEQVAGRDSIVVNATGTIENPDGDIILMFKEVIFAKGDKLYAFTYTATDGEFEANTANFDSVLTTFDLVNGDSMDESKAPSDSMEEPSDSMKETSTEGGGCLIATAAYGTEMAHQVQMLREVRDNTLMNTTVGTSFMTAFNDVYYSFSPTVADWERQSPEFRTVVQTLVTPMIATLSIMSLTDGDSEALTLALGSLVIALNVGIYIAAPTALALRLKK